MKDVLPFFAALVFGIYAISIFSPNGTAQVETLRLEGSDLVVEAQKTHAHPFLAEYDFKIVVKAGSTELDSIDMNDSGGRSRIDVLQIDNSTIAFRHYANTECLNIAREKFEYCGLDISGKRIGKFDFDAKKKWRFIRFDGREN